MNEITRQPLLSTRRTRLHLSKLRLLVTLLATLLATPAAHACVVGSGMSFAEPEVLERRWKGNAHPLVGKAWASDGTVWPAPPGTCQQGPLVEVMTRAVRTVRGGGVVLLGEVHDNPDHHLLRSGMLVASPSQPVPGLVLEHIRTDQQPVLDRFKQSNSEAGRTSTPSDLFGLLEWSKSGWPDQSIFEPLFKAAIEAKLPIVPGEPARDAVRKVAREGESAIASEERARLKLDVPLEPALQDALLTELEESHCGLMPKSAFGNMALAQRYRDAHMADALVKAHAANKSAILLAGNGHVRSDRGVPWYLRQMSPQVKTLSILLLEVEEGKTDPAAYGLRDAAGQSIADLVVFTPRQPRPDPCEEMRKRMPPRKE